MLCFDMLCYDLLCCELLCCLFVSSGVSVFLPFVFDQDNHNIKYIDIHSKKSYIHMKFISWNSIFLFFSFSSFQQNTTKSQIYYNYFMELYFSFSSFSSFQQNTTKTQQKHNRTKKTHL